MEAPALRRRERVADELLDAGERRAELLELALDERRQQRGEHQLRDGGRALGRRRQLPERGSPRRRPTGPARPRERRAPPATPRASGAARAAPPGARSPGRCPPSTTRPPSANVHIPTADRAARPAASARSGASSSRPSRVVSAAATASASLVPEPSPTCSGIASITRRCAPPVSPSASWQRRANASARSASGPSADSSPAGSRLEHDRGAADRHPEPAEAPRAVAGDREHAEVQARGRFDAHGRDRMRLPHSHRASALITERTYHRLALARPTRLVHEHLQPVELGADFLRVEHARTRGEDRRLEHRMARPVEAEELAAAAAVDHDRADPGALRRSRRSPPRAPRATSRRRRAPRPRRWPPDGSAGAGRPARPG